LAQNAPGEEAAIIAVRFDVDLPLLPEQALVDMPGLEQVCDLLDAGPASPTRSAFSGSRSMTSRLGMRSAGSVDTNHLHPTQIYILLD
jgi:hypothetical protein